MQVSCHACFRGAIFLGEPWQGRAYSRLYHSVLIDAHGGYLDGADCDAEVQELLWGGCKVAFLYTTQSERQHGLKIPHGVLSMHCHFSAFMAGLR